MTGTSDSCFLGALTIHPDWLPFLSEEVLTLLVFVENSVRESGFTPESKKVLRFLSLPLESARVVILGQDPYPQPGAATGRAFEVGTLQSWNQPFSNSSLKNIVRSLYKAYTGQVIKYNRLKEKLYDEFPLLPPGKLFEHWEKQGVMLLNTSFTCIPGRSGSHRKIWENFSQRLLRFIAQRVPAATWFLWGNHAKEATRGLNLMEVIETTHPMMCYNRPDRPDDFLYGKQNCFTPFIECIDWTGYGFRQKLVSSPALFRSNQPEDCSP
jgi:uracil-DNA glycosylase